MGFSFYTLALTSTFRLAVKVLKWRSLLLMLTSTIVGKAIAVLNLNRDEQRKGWALDWWCAYLILDFES